MDVAIRQSFSEAMETDSKLSGPDEVVSGSGLLDGTNVEEKKPRADECRQSEALSFSRGLTAAGSMQELPGSQALNESRNELLQRTQALKKDLENWRRKLDTQVKCYREELGGLRSTLNLQVDQLRVGFQDLRNILKHQRKNTATNLADPDEHAEPVIPSHSSIQDTELVSNLSA